MRKLALLVALGATIGFSATIFQPTAHACRCVGIETWQLSLVEVSPGVDRNRWNRWLYYSEFPDGYSILGVSFEIDLEVAP